MYEGQGKGVDQRKFEMNKLCVNNPRQSMKTKNICKSQWQKNNQYAYKQHHIKQ